MVVTFQEKQQQQADSQLATGSIFRSGTHLSKSSRGDLHTYAFLFCIFWEPSLLEFGRGLPIFFPPIFFRIFREGVRACLPHTTGLRPLIHLSCYSPRTPPPPQVPGTGIYVCARLFAFIDCPPSRFSSCFFANYTRSADQNVISPTSTQHSTGRAISSAQVALGIIKSPVAPNHGPHLSAPFIFSYILPCASVAGGVSRLQSAALVVRIKLCWFTEKAALCNGGHSLVLTSTWYQHQVLLQSLY